MSQTKLILAIDQGTTSSRAILFDTQGQRVCSAQSEFKQHYPQPGWVEHDPEEIWSSTLHSCRTALGDAAAGAGGAAVVALGITNQRETTLVWDRASGKAIHPAIVWQDRRTAARCAELAAQGHTALVRERTGLLLDPYFSATKIAWILDHVPGARDRAERGELAFGTVDSFLIWRLTDGAVHATDATNAARTLLFDIHAQRWAEELLALFGVPGTMLPQVKDCVDDFGQTAQSHFGAVVPIRGVAGDQQAATVGQACFEPGTVKSTYGTGCFMVMNTGERAVQSQNGLLTTLAYRLDGRPTYALEGSIFIAGAAVQWLRDSLKLIDSATQTESLARSIDDNDGVYLVPAFVGLGAPHWDPDARGALYGLTRDTGIAHLARAALESVCYQTRDLLVAMSADMQADFTTLRVDGGMVVNDWLLQFLSDLLDVQVQRPQIIETTALGAAYLAGLGAGVFSGFDAIADRWQMQRCFRPAMERSRRERLVDGWARAVQSTLNHTAHSG